MANDDASTPAWPALEQQIRRSTIDIRLLPVPPNGQDLLRALGVTERSTLGALVAHTGGLVIDHGWLRILGGGHAELPDLVEANDIHDATPPPFLLIAHDALGGQFAIDGGGLGIEPGEVCYIGPDTLAWTSIGGRAHGVRQLGPRRRTSGFLRRPALDRLGA